MCRISTHTRTQIHAHTCAHQLTQVTKHPFPSPSLRLALLLFRQEHLLFSVSRDKTLRGYDAVTGACLAKIVVALRHSVEQQSPVSSEFRQRVSKPSVEAVFVESIWQPQNFASSAAVAFPMLVRIAFSACQKSPL